MVGITLYPIVVPLRIKKKILQYLEKEAISALAGCRAVLCPG